METGDGAGVEDRKEETYGSQKGFTFGREVRFFFLGSIRNWDERPAGENHGRLISAP